MPDPKEVYGDILYREHPRSRTHPPMSREARAAQFAPFAALTGYDDLIAESARETETQTELDEDRKAELNRRLSLLLSSEEKPEARFTWFLHDPKKPGGSYVTRTGRLFRYQPQEESITLEDGTVICLRDLKSLECGALEDFD